MGETLGQKLDWPQIHELMNDEYEYEYDDDDDDDDDVFGRRETERWTSELSSNKWVFQKCVPGRHASILTKVHTKETCDLDKTWQNCDDQQVKTWGFASADLAESQFLGAASQPSSHVGSCRRSERTQVSLEKRLVDGAAIEEDLQVQDLFSQNPFRNGGSTKKINMFSDFGFVDITFIVKLTGI